MLNECCERRPSVKILRGEAPAEPPEQWIVECPCCSRRAVGISQSQMALRWAALFAPAPPPSREQLEQLLNTHLLPAMRLLEGLGVGVTVVAMPLVDCEDGRAVVGSTIAESARELVDILQQALREVRGEGRTPPFTLQKS